MKLAAAHPTLIDRLWPESTLPALRWAALVIVGSLLLTASAKAQVPMWPVPMTMQSFVVLVIGMAYGARLSAATVGLYLMEGALGLPVFAGTSSITSLTRAVPERPEGQITGGRRD